MATPKDDRERRKMLPLSDDEVKAAREFNRELRGWFSGRRLRWAIFTIAVVVVGSALAVLSAGVIRNVNRLDALGQQADRDAHLNGYRTCLRQDVTRVELHLAARSRPSDRRIARARLSRVPILDCSPLLHKRYAQPQPLSRTRQLRVIRFYGRTYRLPLIRGRRLTLCPDPNDSQAPVTLWRNVPVRCFKGRNVGG